jgi:aspartyl-tRNA(Asn)/glutamyl-tRNA(Gln) amidotransferase subunit C
MAVTKKDVEYIAVLANLEFNDSEKEGMVDHLNSILGYMDQLNEVNTDHVEPLTTLTDAPMRLREDVIKPSLPNEEALKNAPSKIGPFFRVPKVIEQ